MLKAVCGDPENGAPTLTEFLGLELSKQVKLAWEEECSRQRTEPVRGQRGMKRQGTF